MVRALLAFTLVLIAHDVWAGLSFRQLTFDSIAVLEIEVPADSDLTLGSRNTVNGKVWQEFSLTARAEPRDSILRVRQILSAKDTVRLCTGIEPVAGCRKPASMRERRSLFWICMADFFPTSQVTAPLIADTLGRDRALRVLRRAMENDTAWAVYRYGGVDTFSIQPGSRNPYELGVDPVFWSSPWSRMDLVRIRAQWRRPDSLYGRRGRDSLMLKGKEAYRWQFAGAREADSLPGLVTLGMARELKVYYECLRNESLAEGSRRLVTKQSQFVVEGDSVVVDSLVNTFYSTNAYFVTYSYARARIALKDLDSLLHNMPVGIAGAATKPVPVRISNGAAFLDAGTDQGRLELIGARGQILSKVSGHGRLRLPLTGKGVRWVRWKRGAEQGAVPVVF